MRNIFGVSINKFFAVGFAGLAIALLLVEFISDGVINSWSAVITLSNMIDHLLLIACYLVLFVMNIRNDDRAYMGVSLLVFFIGFDGFFGLSNAFSNAFSYFVNGVPLLGFLFLLSIFLWAGQFGLGVVTYVFVLRYRFQRTENFKLVKLFAILFFIALVLTTGATLLLVFLASPGLPINAYVLSGIYYLSQIAAGACVIFTLNRLRRL